MILAQAWVRARRHGAGGGRRSDVEYHDARAAAEALSISGQLSQNTEKGRWGEGRKESGDRLVARHVTAAIGGDPNDSKEVDKVRKRVARAECHLANRLSAS